MYFPGRTFLSEEVPEAIEAILWFYRCGRDPSDVTQEGEADGLSEEEAFSFEYDADYIYSAFLQAYGIDLTEANLHWWQFQALFRSLPKTVQLVKIIGYRTMDIPAKLPSDQKAYYRRMKELYRLPESEDRKKLESDLNTLLMSGG